MPAGSYRQRRLIVIESLAPYQRLWQTAGASGRFFFVCSMFLALAAPAIECFSTPAVGRASRMLAILLLAFFALRLWLGKLGRLLDTNYRHTIGPLVRHFWSARQEPVWIFALFTYALAEAFSESQYYLALLFIAHGSLGVVFAFDGIPAYQFALKGLASVVAFFALHGILISLNDSVQYTEVFFRPEIFIPTALVLPGLVLAFMANYGVKWIAPAVFAFAFSSVFNCAIMGASDQVCAGLVWWVLHASAIGITMGLPTEKWK